MLGLNPRTFIGMSGFELISRDLIAREMNHQSSKYIPGDEFPAWNYWRVKKCISSFISTLHDEELDYPQDSAVNRMIYLSHFEKVTGQIAYNTNVSVNKRGEAKWISVEKGKELHDLAGWDPKDFLLCHLYFLVDESLKIAEAKRRDNKLDQNLYWDCLISEIVITVNALQILLKYRALEDEDDTKIRKLIKDLISEITKVFQSEEFAEDIVMPCGTSKHTVYMSFICSKAHAKLKIRIDNLGLGSQAHHKVKKIKKTGNIVGIYPRTIAEIPIHNLINYTQLHQYLEKVICLTYRETEDPLDFDTLYNEDPRSTLTECKRIPKDFIDTYKAQPPQKTDHCVVINFYAAALNRVETFKVSIYESAYDKIRDAEMAFIVRFKTPKLTDDQKRQVERRANARLRVRSSFEVKDVNHSRSSLSTENTNIKSTVPYFKRKRLNQLVTYLGKLDQLRTDDHPVTLCAIHGITGSGKSSLVQQYLYETQERDPEAFCWYLEAVWDKDRTRVSYRDHIILLLNNFGIYPSDYTHINSEEAEFKKIKADLWDSIGSYSKWILVFDDAEQLSDIESYLPKISYIRGQILVTTMNPNFLDRYEKRPQGCFDINEGLDPKQALKLFFELSDRSKDEDFRGLLKALGYIPQDIHLAATYLHNHPKCTAETYLQMYSERNSKIWNPRVNTSSITKRQPREVLRSNDYNANNIEKSDPNQTRDDRIQLSMRKLAIENPTIHKLIVYCSFLSNEKFPSKIIDELLTKFKATGTSMFPKFRSVNVNEDLERPLTKYDTYSLLNYDSNLNCYYIHYSTQKLILKMNLPKPSILICLSDIIRGLYHFQEDSIEHNRKIRGLFPHIRSIADQTYKLQLTEETCLLLLLLGQVSLSIGRHRYGLKELHNASKIVEESQRRCCRRILKLCTSNGLYIEILGEIGRAQYFLDLYDDASTTFNRIVEGAKSFYGPKDFRYAKIYLYYVENMTKLKSVSATEVQKEAKKAINISQMVEPESRSKDMTLAQSYRVHAQSLWWLTMKDPMSEELLIQNRLECYKSQDESYKLYQKHLGDDHLWIKRLRLSMSIDHVSKDMESFIDLRLGPVSDQCISDAKARVKAEIENYGSRTPETAVAYQWLSQFQYIEAGMKSGDQQDKLFDALTNRQEATKIWELRDKKLHLMYSHYWTGRIMQRISDGCRAHTTKRHYLDLAIKEYDQTIAIGEPIVENQIDYYEDYVKNAKKWRGHLIQSIETNNAIINV